jgi:hypothetical protein
MVDDFSLRAARMQARAQPPGVASVFPLPMRVHPMWSGNNELGREITFAPDGNNTQMVIKLDEWGPPEVWSVMLGMSFDDENFAPASSGFAVTCRATFGSGGATQEVEIDWVKGTSFSATMNALNIVAIYTAAASVPDNLRLRVTLARGKICNIPPQRARTFGVAGGALSTLIALPYFTKRVRLTGRSIGLTDIYAATNSVNFYGTQDLGSVSAVIPADSFRYFDGCPIPSFAKYIAYDNNGIPDISGDFICELAL